MKADLCSVHASFLCRTVLAVAALIFCGALVSRAAEEMRTWTDSTGKFKIKAKFVEVKDGKLLLEADDGSRKQIPLDKLGEADRKLAGELQAAKEENPFQNAKPAAAGQDSGEPKILKPQWAGVKQVLVPPVNDAGKWSLPIKAPEQPPAGKVRSVAISLGTRRNFFEGVTGLAINPICRQAVVGYFLDKDEKPVRLAWCDLQSGKLLASLTATGKVGVLALNDTGTEVLMCRNEFGFGNHDRLELWTLGPAKVTKGLVWVAYDNPWAPNRDVKWARFVDDGKLLTLSSGGKLALWDAAAAKPLYWLQIQGHGVPALTPDRKHLVFGTDKEIGVLDIAAGEVVDVQAAPNGALASPTFAFTPKGTRLARGAGDRIYVWDTATGALPRDSRWPAPRSIWAKTCCALARTTCWWPTRC